VAGPSDEELLASADAAAFEAFYRRHVETILGALARRSGDPALAAELTAETFAVALSQRTHRPARPPADWLLSLAADELAEAERRGRPRRRARRQLGMAPLELDAGEVARIEALAATTGAADAVRVRVIE
jgi:DNA-directed RNA polymerase specialized sigma24 family protein